MLSHSPTEKDYFSSIPIQIFSDWFSGGELLFSQRENVVLDKSNIKKFAQRVPQKYPQELKGLNYCIISGKTNLEKKFEKQEHFVPEALGFEWTKVPKGLGTCDDTNEFFGKHETEWSRYGIMGFLRPFYVKRSKKGSPEYHAPKKSQAILSVLNDKHGNLKMIYRRKLGLPDTEGPGHLDAIGDLSRESRSESVSLSLHKMAFLTLWLISPDLTLDQNFEKLRIFLNNPNEQTYMPFLEEFIPGAIPGVRFAFYVKMLESELDRDGDKRIFDLGNVNVAVKAHHMLYRFALIGDMDLQTIRRDTILRTWNDEEAVQKSRPFPVFKFGRMARRSLTEDDEEFLGQI